MCWFYSTIAAVFVLEPNKEREIVQKRSLIALVLNQLLLGLLAFSDVSHTELHQQAVAVTK